MKIIDFEANYCTRFKLHGGRKIKLTFTEVVQLILGTNGSGKSSLMHLLTPLPADPSDFRKEGSKIITIEHRGYTYVSKSVFKPSAKHSLTRDGIELNEGGTATQQRDLCKEIFGITPEIHSMLTGQTTFTDMSPAERRKWMMLLSGSDWDFAMRVYNDLRTQARDIEGQLRLTKKRLALESEKVISAEEERKLSNDVDQLHRELQILMEARAPVTKPVQAYQDENQIRLDQLTQLSAKLLKMRFVAPYGYKNRPAERDEWGSLVRPSYQSIGEVDAEIDNIRREVTIRETLLAETAKAHQHSGEQLEILTKTGEETLADLETQLVKKATDAIAVLEQKRLKLEFPNSQNALSALLNLEETLVEIFSELPENSEQTYSSSKMEAASAQADVLSAKVRQLEHQLRQVVAKREHLDEHEKNQGLECPKCTHKFVVGYSPGLHAAVKEDQRLLELELEKVRESLAVQQAIYDANLKYGGQYRNYFRMTKAWPALNPFWDYVHQEQLVTHNPTQVLRDVFYLKEDLDLDSVVAKIDQETIEIKRLIVAKEQLGDATLSKVRDEHESQTVRIEQLTSELTQLQRALSEHREYKQNLLEAASLSERIKEMHSDATQCLDEMIEMIRRETIQHCMRQLQTALSRKEETLSFVQMQKGLVLDLEDQLRQLEVQDNAAKLLVTCLSPKEGLIAEGLLGFIRSFVNQMNHLIKQVWTYPLVVEDCAAEDSQFAELDFKFPLRSEGQPVADVKLGSTGQQGIVNLSFKVSAMARLGLLESPLFLDEFGAAFDATHRHTSSLMISNLMEQKPFTQLFMVSHYEEAYGAFNKPEICVLCPSNIEVPGNMEYNKHVQIH